MITARTVIIIVLCIITLTINNNSSNNTIAVVIKNNNIFSDLSTSMTFQAEGNFIGDRSSHLMIKFVNM